MDRTVSKADDGRERMITNLLLLLIVAMLAGLAVLAGYGIRAVLVTALSYAHDLRANLEEANRLTSRLIELETAKQGTRESGRNLLRERIAERVAQEFKARAKG
jgi:hypothetical protein